MFQLLLVLLVVALPRAASHELILYSGHTENVQGGSQHEVEEHEYGVVDGVWAGQLFSPYERTGIKESNSSIVQERALGRP